MRKDARLPCRARSAMASHGRKQKGPESPAGEEIDGGPHDRGKIRNPPTADTDGDARARVDARIKVAGQKFAVNGGWNIVEFSMREMLSNGQEHAVPIIESLRCYAKGDRGDDAAAG